MEKGKQHAFPSIEQLTQSVFGGQFAVEGSLGITYRQWLAGMALQGLVAHSGANCRPADVWNIVDHMLNGEGPAK